MALANQEAQRFNHEYIGTEHILLGLVKEGSGVGANVLKNLDIDLRKVRLEVEKLVKSGPDMVTMGKLPQTPRAKKVLEYAIEEARHLNHNYVGTEHLLLGLLREQDLMSDARPWSNYTAHYRPMVELAKAAGLPVIAANPPRRYVSAAGRIGPEVLTQRQWSARLRADLPPLPLPKPSAEYTARLLRDKEVAPRDTEVVAGPLPASAVSDGCPYIGLCRSGARTLNW